MVRSEGVRWPQKAFFAALALVGAASILFSLDSSAQQSRKDKISEFEKSIYAEIEKDIRRQFEEGVTVLNRVAKNQQELVVATNGLRSLLYNKAHAHTACWGETLASARQGESESDAQQRQKVCFDEWADENQILMKLSDYAEALPSGTAVRCEMEARLFGRELLFPPYDFLKTQGHENMLVNPRVFSQCLRSKN